MLQSQNAIQEAGFILLLSQFFNHDITTYYLYFVREREDFRFSSRRLYHHHHLGGREVCVFGLLHELQFCELHPPFLTHTQTTGVTGETCIILHSSAMHTKGMRHVCIPFIYRIKPKEK